MADQGEIKIPVLSVLKNGITLKNIFLNNPKWENLNKNQDQGDDDFVIIGRHPDCHVVLNHPSISRFHLEIRANPASRKLSVIDLNSVHGTWVSGGKIQPNIPADLVEGDTVKLGASTRVYKLHWVSMGSAFEMEKPILPALPEENEQSEDSNAIWAQDMALSDPLSLPSANNNQIQAVTEFEQKIAVPCSAVSVSAVIGSLLPTEGENATLSDPLSFPSANNSQIQAVTEFEQKSPVSCSAVSVSAVIGSLLPTEVENATLSDPLSFPSANNSQIQAVTEFEQKSSVSCSAVSVSAVIGSLWPTEGENATLSDPLSLPSANNSQIQEVTEFEQKSPMSCSATSVSAVIGSLSPTEGENTTPEKNGNANDVQSEREYKKNPLKSCSILSRRSKSKLVSSLCINTGRAGEEMVDRSSTRELDIEHEREEILCRVLFAGSKEEEGEEGFLSDKLNVTPSSQMSHKANHQLSLNSSEILMTREEPFSSAEETLSHVDPVCLKQCKPISQTCSLDKKNNNHEEDLQESSLKAIAALIEEDDVFYSDKENWTPEVPGKMKSKKGNHLDCMQTNEGGEQEDEAFISDKENMTPKPSGYGKSKEVLPVEFLNVGGEEASFSDSKNLTLIASGVKKSKKVLTGIRKGRIPFQSVLPDSPTKNGSPLKTEHNIIVNKDRTPFKPVLERSPLNNCSPLNDAQRVGVKARVPFQSLLESSPAKSGQRTAGKERVLFQSLQSSPLRNSSPLSNARKTEETSNRYSAFIPVQTTEDQLRSNSSTHNADQVCQKVEGNKKKWNMIVDTECFLNEESRKSLQLLEGLKGTQLIIPSIVIRELESLKRRESLFRKEAKTASLVLNWIEECMVKSSWWIHVQSSIEMTPTALTPPATPITEFCDNCDKNLMEIVSPTAEDHILNFALMFKRIKDEEQLALLTDSITLKIKAMAEGLICETLVEFRESLVNPYSKRFLWSASSPRGSTWSCMEEAGLIKNCYYQFPVIRRPAEVTESIRGLKLILLHNSHYGILAEFSHYAPTS